MLLGPDTGLGFTEYFTETWLVDASGEHSFEDGLAFTDDEPELMVLAMLEDETSKRAQFRFDFDLAELRVRVTEAGDIAVESAVAE